MFSPSLRNGPFTGLEWSFLLRDEGFDCSGKKIKETVADIEDFFSERYGAKH